VNNFSERFLLMAGIYDTNKTRQGKPICKMKQKTSSIWERGGWVETSGMDHPLSGKLRFMPAGGFRTVSRS
jgi:hypothetical protein